MFYHGQSSATQEENTTKTCFMLFYPRFFRTCICLLLSKLLQGGSKSFAAKILAHTYFKLQ